MQRCFLLKEVMFHPDHGPTELHCFGLDKYGFSFRCTGEVEEVFAAFIAQGQAVSAGKTISPAVEQFPVLIIYSLTTLDL